MIEYIIFLIVVLFILYIFFITTQPKPVNNMRIIHSSLHNRSFYINDYNDNIISDIQLSLNHRDGYYKIIFKDNFYLLKDNKIINSIEIVNYQ